jgi:hypothetical protein
MEATRINSSEPGRLPGLIHWDTLQVTRINMPGYCAGYQDKYAGILCRLPGYG